MFPPRPSRTHTLMQTSCWRQPSSWLRPESATRRRSTRQPDTWKSESRTLSAESSTGSCCWTCPSPSTHTPRRWGHTQMHTETQKGTHSQTSCCSPFWYNGVEMWREGKWCAKLITHLQTCLSVCVCPAVVVDGGAAEAAVGRRLLRFGGFSSDSDPAVSAAADGHAGSNAQCD